MAEARADRRAVIAEVGGHLDAAEAVVLTEYRGLDVPALAELRQALQDAGGTYRIYKNSLVRMAAKERGLDIDDMLQGPTAIAFVEGDLAGVAKALRDYAKGNPNLVVKGGLLGDAVISAQEVRALADLPSRQNALTQIASLIDQRLQSIQRPVRVRLQIATDHLVAAIDDLAALDLDGSVARTAQDALEALRRIEAQIAGQSSASLSDARASLHRTADRPLSRWFDGVLDQVEMINVSAADLALQQFVEAHRSSLILVRPGSGTELLPIFQIESLHRSEILRVNEALDAEAFPESALAWWLDPLGELGGRPPIAVIEEAHEDLQSLAASRADGLTHF